MKRQDYADWARYLYFLRFCFFLWLFPIILIAINELGGRSITSGIVTPETFEEILCSSFFIISSSFVALIIARITVINGSERFREARPPHRLRHLLSDNFERYEFLAVFLALLPAIGTFTYFLLNGLNEGVKLSRTIEGVFFGTVLAFLFWYVVNVLYYISYRFPTVLPPPKLRLGKNAARTILLPRRLFLLARPYEVLRNDTIEAAVNPLYNTRISNAFVNAVIRLNNLVPLKGYIHPNTRQLYEAQFFSLIAIAGFIFLYLVMWPLTAPVPTKWASLAIIAVVLLGGFLIFILAGAKASVSAQLRIAQISIAGALVFTAAVPILYYASDAERFPVFASILIVATMATWILSGVAFFLDRYRIPVLTLILLSTIVPRWLHLDFGREEHFMSINTAGQVPKIVTPAEVLLQWIKSPAFDASRPLVIVTATGGGLHASAWTAAVLGQLEAQIDPDRSTPLYSRILLMSSVSGGSTGLMSYLNAIQTDHDFTNAALVSAGCSSLEAVGWGMIYDDLPSAFLLPVSWPFGSSSGIGDLDGATVFGKDRTWSLRKGFERNLKDTYCDNVWNDKRTHIGLSEVRSGILRAQDLQSRLTLATLTVQPRIQPAIAMNTTTAEHGDRFLLANYGIPRYKLGRNEADPAESFLQVYGPQNLSGPDTQPLYPDLPLATAAQLSGTFPYVSSAARFPLIKGREAVHFIDGGYYDNDGTASVLEFLRYAMDDPAKAQKAADLAHTSTQSALRDNAEALREVRSFFAGKHLRIVLIEIRNSADDPADSPATDSPRALPGKGCPPQTAGNMLFQAIAPLLGFWNAGHQSVTARNRAALDLLKEAYANRLQIHHVVIPDKLSGVMNGTDPLNWSLTPAQRQEIKSSLKSDEVKAQCADAVRWILDLKSEVEWSEGQASTLPISKRQVQIASPGHRVMHSIPQP